MKTKVLHFFVSVMLLCSISRAQIFDQKIKHISYDRDTLDAFGYSVAISGDYAIVGAPYDYEDAAGVNLLKKSGSAYIFKKTAGIGNNWIQLKKIVPSNRDTSFNFGISVAIDSNYIVVGASGANSAYIFKKDQGGTDNWGEIKKLDASDKGPTDSFGASVCIQNGIIVVGAVTEDEDASGLNAFADAGAAYIFNKDLGGIDNWGELKKIVAADRSSTSFSAMLGNSISISGDYIVIGAYRETKGVIPTNLIAGGGACYIYKKDFGGTDNWGQLIKIVSSDRAQSDNFGKSVAIFGDDLIVGAWGEDEDANGLNTMPLAGSAYLFKKNQGGADNWGQFKKIVAADRSSSDYFGSNVSLSYDHVIISAAYDHQDENGINYLANAGSVYIFNRNDGGANNWGQIQKLTATDRGIQDKYGFAGAIDSNEIIISAPYNDLDLSGGNYQQDGGSVYFLEYSNPALLISGGTLTAAVTGAIYQWVDCNNNYAIIPGEVGQSFTPTTNGSYAVMVTQNNITDTTVCKNIIVTGIKNSEDKNIHVSVFPNPAGKQIIIVNEEAVSVEAGLFDSLGKLIYSGILPAGKTSIDITPFTNGIYTLKLISNNKTTTQKIIIN